MIRAVRSPVMAGWAVLLCCLVAAPSSAASTRPAPALPERDDERHAEQAGRTAACSRLAGAVQALDARMRAGYSAREAARLWARWREAKERLREADC